MDKEEQNILKSVAEVLVQNNLSEIEYEKDDLRIKVVSNKPSDVEEKIETVVVPQQPIVSPNLKGIKSPMVGIVYLQSDPSAEPYVKVGDKVSKGQTVCIVEAMKTFNQICAPEKGVIKGICVSNGDPIEYDQLLFEYE